MTTWVAGTLKCQACGEEFRAVMPAEALRLNGLVCRDCGVEAAILEGPGLVLEPGSEGAVEAESRRAAFQYLGCGRR